MEIKYRTFQEGDESGVVNIFNSAFCKTRFCQPMTKEFWQWKYKTRPPRFIPEGIMLAEKKGIIVGSVIVTFHKMRFGEYEFLLGGIDDVATCPLLEKRGIARNLMERAIEFTRDYGADASVLMADPNGHASRLYNKLGYDYTTYYSLFFKMVNPLKLKNEILPLAPLIPFIYLTKLKGKKQKEVKNIQYQIQKVESGTFYKQIKSKLQKFNWWKYL